MPKRNAIWRSPVNDIDYASCSNIELDGVLIPMNSGYETTGNILLYSYVSLMEFTPGCYGKKPVYSASKKLGFATLPVVQQDWYTFINHRKEGEFMYSIYPTVYLLTAATVVTCFLTVIVFTNTQRPSTFLILGCLLSSINLINILSSSMKFLANSIDMGQALGENLLDNIQLNMSFNVIDLFSVFILQLCQVQIIMRLFSRQKEKRFTFVMGVSLSIISQVIWAISTFHSMKHSDLEDYDPDTDSLSIMPAFIYLLRIAMSVMYSVLICVYCFIKIEFIMNKSLLLISLVSILSTNLQFAFFIADVANVWVAELSEVFNAAGYVVSTVIVWEWINRIHACERAKQHKGILGRPFYEEELGAVNKVDRISLFVPEEEDKLLSGRDDDSFRSFPSDGTHNDAEEPITSPKSVASNLNSKIRNFVTAQQMKTTDFVSITIPEMVKKTTDTFWYLTDQIIAYGLAVPRSVSVNSKERVDRKKLAKKLTSHKSKKHSINDTSSNESILIFNSNNREDTNEERVSENASGAQRPIFVYSTAQVAIDHASETHEEEDFIYQQEDDIAEGSIADNSMAQDTTSQTSR